MSIIAVAVKHLIAAGVTNDALVTAIAEMEKALIPEKSAAAKRQARYRERNKPSQSVTSVTCDASPLDSFNGFPHPSLTSLEPPKENPPIGGQKKAPRRGTRLTAGWELEQEWGEWAESQGMKGEDVLREAAKFKDFWLAKAGPNATKADWEATWRNWVRTYLEGFKK